MECLRVLSRPVLPYEKWTTRASEMLWLLTASPAMRLAPLASMGYKTGATSDAGPRGHGPARLRGGMMRGGPEDDYEERVRRRRAAAQQRRNVALTLS